ncbi:MAG TPA: ATP-binding cassette domain-containing protein [Bryobacteraceae bacterium]|nr:ATP-binding cassette domain-containing protein [Bryobacteraceae bacterium]
MAALLEFHNVTCRIAGREILHGINLSVGRGETVVLLGRSGSGKTTLLKMVNRLVDAHGGQVRFEGVPVTDQDPIRLRRRIGYVIQEGGLFPHVTVERNVGLVPRLENWPEEKVRERVFALLRMMGLPPEEYASRRPRQLSGGEKQRVGIARALAAEPPLLLLDEPFAALDPVTRFELQKQFVELRRRLGTTALFVTHDVREAVMMASRIAVLKDGAIELVAPPEEFLNASIGEAAAFLASVREDRTTSEWRTRF